MATAALGTVPAGAAPPDPSTDARTYEVGSAVYNLGDSAFTAQGHNPPPVELAGIVHYPKRPGGRALPLVMMLHGSWYSCADKDAETAAAAAELAAKQSEARGDTAETENQRAKATAHRQALGRWPCAPDVQPMRSYRGYDYLGKELASRGYTVVSISADSVDAQQQLEGRALRTSLLNKHLAMWEGLAASGRGELAGKFTDPQTGEAKPVDFTNRIDMASVGTLGHSRGGAGVLDHASDKKRPAWPSGVQVKAVFAMEPAALAVPEPLPVTGLPLATLLGTCDGLYQEGKTAAALGDSRNRYPTHQFSVQGANHNFFNTQWSPDGGQPASSDDATHEEGGRCRTTSGEGSAAVQQLTPTQQREVAKTYVTAFFDRHLRGQDKAEAILNGTAQPAKDITEVKIKTTSHGSSPAPEDTDTTTGNRHRAQPGPAALWAAGAGAAVLIITAITRLRRNT
ncbi:alpha/beta hydrolase [Streptomyces olivoreticuli]|uniref:alpha/beta hydrolase n=1 Tax=Streptomyces olivoreticuli TaxID=68246 RepID=UPI000E276BE0|nr:alpha/beta hydrolase [Streptomyces olivoreticuli]